MKKWLLGFLGFAVLMLPVSSQAKENKNDQEPVLVMEDVVVTATKTEEKRKNIPHSVIVIDEADIQESSATSLGDLLSNELGIDWRTRGNYGGAVQTLQIRGMRADETQIYLNGVSMNSPSLGPADVGQISLNNIERIEVVKGSGSVLYGSGAMAGVVNIITKRPKRDRMDFKVTAGYGSEDTYQLSAEQGMFSFGDFGYYLTANRRETDGFRDNSDLTHNDASLKLVLDKGDILDISLYGEYVDRDFGRPGIKPPAGTPDFFINGVKFYNSDAASLLDKGGNEDTHAVLEIKSAPQEWIRFNVRSDYTDMESYNYTRYNAAGYTTRPVLAGEGLKTWVNNKVLGVEGNLEIKPFNDTSLLLGADYEDHEWDKEDVGMDTAGANLSATKTTQNEKLHSKGSYAELQYRPCKFFKVLAGIRREKHSTFGSETLPHYGLIINPLEKTVLKFNRGKHFKAPTPNDLFWPDDGFTRGNPDLKAQTGWHTDATIEQGLFDDKLFVSLTYFDWKVDDKIAWAENPNYPNAFGGYYWTPSNVNKSNGKGWEAGVKINPFYSLSFALDYTYTDAEDEAPTYKRPAQYTPEHQFKGNMIYRSDFGLTASATVRYVSDRDFFSGSATSPTATLDSYWTTDLKLEQRLYNNWLLSFQANNLFDKGYDTYYSSYGFVDGTGTSIPGFYQGAEQSVFFSVSYEY